MMKMRAFAALSALVGTLAISNISMAEEKPELPAGGPVEIESPVPDGFDSWLALMKVQERLDSVADKISGLPQSDSSGYGNLRVDVKTNSIDVFWKGGKTSSLLAVVEEAAHSGVDVVVKPADYTQSEIQEEIGRILGDSRSREPSRGASRAYAAPDASSIYLYGTGSEEALRQVPSIHDSQVPVVIFPDAPVSVDNYDRRHDVPAYWGGSYMFNIQTGGACTTGLAMENGDEDFLLTAAHCVKTGDTVLVNSDPNTPDGAGKVVSRSASKDIAKVRMDGNPSTAGRIYWRDYLTSHSEAVFGTGGNHKGDYVCQSGAASGTICGIYTEAVGVSSWSHEMNQLVTGLAQGYNKWGAATGQGDSGAPVVSVSSNGLGVFARGVVSQGISDVFPPACEGLQHPGRICSRTVLWEGISSATSVWGKVKTSPWISN
ncbi:trypsin-like serine protease [Streptomyces sp. NPDC002952]|uniref:trypsin-like serine protease n=1 Tax=Streptomyces sp. NPDC002952 TaxID=3364673 RepID=UPI0036C63188